MKSRSWNRIAVPPKMATAAPTALEDRPAPPLAESNERRRMKSTMIVPLPKLSMP